MARDRKRAKQRRERQAKAEGAQSRRAQRRVASPQDAAELSGEASIADAQLALGRPELADEADVLAAEQASANGAPDTFEDEAEFEQLEDRVDAAEDFDGDGDLEVAAAPGAPARRRSERSEGNRFANFLRGSWRELQRVQWPDRTQVGQATAVCIGFVIIMGAFLGAMDFLAARIVDFIV